MSLITSPEMFINMKSIPDARSKEYLPFFENERQKSKSGVVINGTRIPGWLYWHTNHWTIDIDHEDPITKFIERETRLPDLRDNEWMIGEKIDQAETERKGLLILGSRQLGKSEFGASYEGRRSILFENSQNILAGLSESDLSLLISKLKRGFKNLTPYFRPLTIRSNDQEIILGFKNAQGENFQWSEILIRNLAKGKNTENLAGPTTSSLLLDEIGKGEFLAAFVAARPAMETPYGWRASPIFTGTSGSFDKSQDLQKFYNNLDTYNFLCLTMKDKYDGKEKKFIPGHHSSRAQRKRVRLSKFLGVKKGSELDDIAIHVVRDEEAEVRMIKGQIEAYERANEFVLAKKEQMYYPIIEDDLFLTADIDNPFADIRDICKEQLKYLEEIADTGERYGWMQRDVQTGQIKFVDAKPGQIPVKEFPTGDQEDKDAPIIMFEDRLEGAEFGILHVSGSDVYNTDESFYSPSLGTLYVYRRTYDPMAGRFQESIVASYAARPKKVDKWLEQVRFLLEYYQATCLSENADAILIRHMDDKMLGHYMEDGIDIAKEINPGTKVKMRKGLSPTVPNIRYGNGLIKNYCMEEIIVGQMPNGDPIIKQGVVRIKDKALLKEIIAYKPKMNVDRIVGFRHALIIAASKDKFFPVSKLKPQPKEEKPKPKPPRTPFTRRPGGGAFGSRRKGPF